MDDKRIVDSIIDKNCKIYNVSSIKKAKIASNVIIGDDSIILNSTIKSYTSINRRNSIINSLIDMFSYTGTNCTIRNSIIGKFCSISWNVSIGGGDHEYRNVSTMNEWRFNMLKQATQKGDVSTEGQCNVSRECNCNIGNDVWIATNAVVLGKASIGDGSVIGAGSVVTKDIQPYSIAVGSPARVISQRFSDSIISDLLEIRWWNWPIELISDHKEIFFQRSITNTIVSELKSIITCYEARRKDV